MNFVDSQIVLRAKASLDEKGAIVFGDSVTRVHFATTIDTSLALTLKRLCGGALLGVEPASTYFTLSEGKRDGSLRTMEIRFEGDEMSKALKELFSERRKQLQEDKEQGRAPEKRVFKPTSEEALYHAFITHAEIQIDVQTEGAEPASLSLILDYVRA